MILFIPMGYVDKEIIENLKQPLATIFGEKVVVGETIELPPESRDRRRRQYLASRLLELIPLPKPGDRALAIVDVDIFASGLNFVFGETDIVGRRAVISLQRLRQEFYGLPRDEKLFRERTLKEAVHELGHTYGLGHCPNPGCVMHFSNSLYDTDWKGWNFCSICHKKLKLPN